MLRAVIVVAGVLAAGGCSDPSTDPGDELADRVEAALADDTSEVVDRLHELGVDVDTAAVAGATVTCPSIEDAQPGDLATCVAEVAGTDVAVEVEFAQGDAIRVLDLSVVQ